MKSQDLVLLRQKVRLYKKEESIVHVVLVNTRKFYNGKISEVSKDSFIIKDKKAEVPVLFNEVFKIEVYEKNIK